LSHSQTDSKRDWSYAELSQALAEKGIAESPKNLSSKFLRGTLNVVRFFEILHVLGVRELQLL
jgi:hypothetical protein